MKRKIYAIRDGKGEYYNQPFFLNTHGEAERTLLELRKDEKSMIHKYPEDYDLYHLGEYDDQTGQIAGLATPSHILKATNCPV